MKKRILKIINLIMLLIVFITYKKKTNKINNKKTVLSPAVMHIKDSFQTKNNCESINLLKINLTDTRTQLQVGLPQPLNQLKTVKSLATRNSTFRHQVITATNAAFFIYDHYPANLIAVNNTIINYGMLGENYESPTQEPVAFGINQAGDPLIDYFNTELTASIGNQTVTIDRINKNPEANQTVLHTQNNERTTTSSKRFDIVVEGSKELKNISFGEHYQGTVTSIQSSKESRTIPEHGFIISIENKQLIKNIKLGDAVLLLATIDEQWQDAQFILAAGPLLVKDGKESISMPTDASFVTAKHARTAIGIDYNGDILLMTADKNTTTHNNGLSLPDLAQYLISKEAHSAINLDGGSSTTMIIRNQDKLKLASKPKYLYEPKVSAILQVVQTNEQ